MKKLNFKVATALLLLLSALSLAGCNNTVLQPGTTDSQAFSSDGLADSSNTSTNTSRNDSDSNSSSGKNSSAGSSNTFDSSGQQSSTPGSSSTQGGGTQKVAVPTWYTPGELTVLTVLNNATSVMGMSTVKTPLAFTPLAANSNCVYLPDSASVDVSSKDADFIKLKRSPEYPNGSGIYYDIKNKKTICFSAIADSAARTYSILPAGGFYYLFLDDPASGNCILDVRSSDYKPHSYYFLNIYDKRLLPFPIELYATPGVIFSSNKRYYAASLPVRDKGDIIYLIDTSGQTLEKINVSEKLKGVKAFPGNYFFSDKSKYLIYSVYDEYGKLNDEQNFPNMALYNIEAQTTIRFTGNCINFINNDKAVVIETKDGGKVIDPDTGEDITAKTTLENWQKYKVIMNPTEGKKASAKLVSLFSKEPDTSPVGFVDSIFAEEKYIYYYNDGDAFITCYNIDNKKSFQTPVDEGFVAEIKGISRTQYKVCYNMSLSTDKTKLLLFYWLDRPDNYSIQS